MLVNDPIVPILKKHVNLGGFFHTLVRMCERARFSMQRNGAPGGPDALLEYPVIRYAEGHPVINSTADTAPPRGA